MSVEPGDRVSRRTAVSLAIGAVCCSPVVSSALGQTPILVKPTYRAAYESPWGNLSLRATPSVDEVRELEIVYWNTTSSPKYCDALFFLPTKHVLPWLKLAIFSVDKQEFLADLLSLPSGSIGGGNYLSLPPDGIVGMSIDLTKDGRAEPHRIDGRVSKGPIALQAIIYDSFFASEFPGRSSIQKEGKSPHEIKALMKSRSPRRWHHEREVMRSNVLELTN